MHIKFVLQEFVAIYILPLSPPGGITVVYIYTDESFKNNLIMPCKGKISREEGFLGGQ